MRKTEAELNKPDLTRPLAPRTGSYDSKISGPHDFCLRYSGIDIQARCSVVLHFKRKR